MRPVLRLLGTRYGIALLLILLVLGVVGVLKGINGSSGDPLAVSPAVTPSAVASSVDAGDDSVTGDESPQPPVTSPGAAPPTEIATAFARAWLNHDGVTGDQWRSGLTKYATPALMEKLKNTDPAVVPAKSIAGAVTLEPQASTLVNAVIPLDSGTLRLRLLGSNGKWLVDGIDWGRT
jgi:hypothetical protein